MISSKLVTTVTFLYLFCTVLYFIFLAFRSRKLGNIAVTATWMALLLHTVAIIWRWVESYQLGIGHAPLSNMYESLVFFSWCIALVYLIWEWRLKTRVVGSFAMPFAFLTIAYAALSSGVSDRIDPLIPALQSNWLHAHVVTCFLSYASFAVSCGISVMYLLKARKEESGQKDQGALALFPVAHAEEFLDPEVAFKFSAKPAGLFVYHNTIIGEQTPRDPSSNVHWRNNLFMGRGTENRGVMSWPNATSAHSTDYNGFRPNPGVAAQYWWLAPNPGETAYEPKPGQAKTFRTLAEFRSATGQEAHGIEVDFDIFENLARCAPRQWHPCQRAATLRPIQLATERDGQLAGKILPLGRHHHGVAIVLRDDERRWNILPPLRKPERRP